MLKRKITEKLRRWRTEHDEECLVVKGARQVGKTYAIEEFGRSNYECLVTLNFIERPELKEAFDGDLSSAEIKKRLTLYDPSFSFPEGETLLFLDEIQECPNARTALKFLAQDRAIDVVASGSLLGISYSESVSIPVGYERQIQMEGLDFEEYLWAKGYDDDVMNEIRGHFETLTPIAKSANDRLLGILREYMAIGGMPAVVQGFVDKQSFSVAFSEQQMILDSYLDDIAKYASVRDRNKARECYMSVPRQLAKENTKFKYGIVEKRGTARKFETALDWLRDAQLVRYCRFVTTPSFPLRAYENESRFRIYLSDPGLLCAMYGFEMIGAVVNDKLVGPMKGGIYENLVADMLAKSGHDLHYWMSDKGDAEIEFLLDRDAGIVPIEVKAKRGSTASLDKMLERKDVHLGYKLSSGNVGIAGKLVTLPLYMAMFIR